MLNENYFLATAYTDETVAGGGAIKGKNCTIKSITPITGGNRVEFEWTLDNGTVLTDSIDVMDGQDGEKGDTGLGIKSVAIDAQNHLIVTFDDDTTSDAGELTDLNTSFDNIDDVDLNNLQDGQVLKYDETSGKWKNASAGTVETNLSDLNDVDFDNLSDGQIIVWDATANKWKNAANSPSITVDDALSTTSENPVQNKVLTLTIQDLQASVLGKVDKVTGKGLSTEDYTTAEKTKLAGLENYDDTALQLAVEHLQASKLDKDDAFSGSYNDLTDKPTIPDELSEQTDTNISSPANGQELVYDSVSGKWKNKLTQRELSWAEYEALSTEEKNNGTVYYVPDKNFPVMANDVLLSSALNVDGTSVTIVESALEAINNLAAGNKTDIGNIKDGTTIDSFGDVETALGLKQNQLLSSALNVDGVSKTTVEAAMSAINDLAAANKSGKADKVASATANNFAGLDANGNLKDSGKKASDFSTPSDIQDVYEVMGKNGAKNLFENTLTQRTIYELTATPNSDGSVIIDTAGEALTTLVSIDYGIITLPAGKYIVSADTVIAGSDYKTFLSIPNGGGDVCYVTSLDGTEFTLAQETTVLMHTVFYSGKTISNIVFKPQIRYAEDTDPTYQPYAMNNQELTKKAQNTFYGHKATWDALSQAEKIKYEYAEFDDDETGNAYRVVAETSANQTYGAQLEALKSKLFALSFEEKLKSALLFSDGTLYSASRIGDDIIQFGAQLVSNNGLLFGSCAIDKNNTNHVWNIAGITTSGVTNSSSVISSTNSTSIKVIVIE